MDFKIAYGDFQVRTGKASNAIQVIKSSIENSIVQKESENSQEI